MAFPGELKGFDGTTCGCGRRLELQVLCSSAGYYLGYECDRCGPHSRETYYFQTRAAAKTELKKANQGEIPAMARDTEYHP